MGTLSLWQLGWGTRLTCRGNDIGLTETYLGSGVIGQGEKISRNTQALISAVVPWLERRGVIQMVIAQEGLCCDRKWLGGTRKAAAHANLDARRSS